jgi:hypothetical protein
MPHQVLRTAFFYIPVTTVSLLVRFAAIMKLCDDFILNTLNDESDSLVANYVGAVEQGKDR